MIAPKRILPSSTPPPQRPAAPPIPRKQVLRVGQACTACRRQKMRCEGADNPPCVRCRVSSTACIFERVSKSEPMDPSVHERLAEMEHEIGMVKATQRQMQTMLGEILNELRRGSGRPLPSSATEGPTVCSCTAGVVLPVAAQTSPVLMSNKTETTSVTLETTPQPHVPLYYYQDQQLRADTESLGGSSSPPTVPNQLPRKRKRITSGGSGSADHSRGEPGSRNTRLTHNHQPSMPLLPPENKEQDIFDNRFTPQHDVEQLFGLYAFLPPHWP